MSKSPDAFRTISEVAEWLAVQAHVLRFWESKFPQLKPVKRAGGRRYYRPADMLLLGGIRYLLHDKGLSIKEAQALLRDKGAAFINDMSHPLEAPFTPGSAGPSNGEFTFGDDVAGSEQDDAVANAALQSPEPELATPSDTATVDAPPVADTTPVAASTPPVIDPPAAQPDTVTAPLETVAAPASVVAPTTPAPKAPATPQPVVEPVAASAAQPAPPAAAAVEQINLDLGPSGAAPQENATQKAERLQTALAGTAAHQSPASDPAPSGGAQPSLWEGATTAPTPPATASSPTPAAQPTPDAVVAAPAAAVSDGAQVALPTGATSVDGSNVAPTAVATSAEVEPTPSAPTPSALAPNPGIDMGITSPVQPAATTSLEGTTAPETIATSGAVQPPPTPAQVGTVAASPVEPPLAPAASATIVAAEPGATPAPNVTPQAAEVPPAVHVSDQVIAPAETAHSADNVVEHSSMTLGPTTAEQPTPMAATTAAPTPDADAPSDVPVTFAEAELTSVAPPTPSTPPVTTGPAPQQIVQNATPAAAHSEPAAVAASAPVPSSVAAPSAVATSHPTSGEADSASVETTISTPSGMPSNNDQVEPDPTYSSAPTTQVAQAVDHAPVEATANPMQEPAVPDDLPQMPGTTSQPASGWVTDTPAPVADAVDVPQPELAREAAPSVEVKQPIQQPTVSPAPVATSIEVSPAEDIVAPPHAEAPSDISAQDDLVTTATVSDTALTVESTSPPAPTVAEELTVDLPSDETFVSPELPSNEMVDDASEIATAEAKTVSEELQLDGPQKLDVETKADVLDAEDHADEPAEIEQPRARVIEIADFDPATLVEARVGPLGRIASLGQIPAQNQKPIAECLDGLRALTSQI